MPTALAKMRTYKRPLFIAKFLRRAIAPKPYDQDFRTTWRYRPFFWQDDVQVRHFLRPLLPHVFLPKCTIPPPRRSESPEWRLGSPYHQSQYWYYLAFWGDPNYHLVRWGFSLRLTDPLTTSNRDTSDAPVQITNGVGFVTLRYSGIETPGAYTDFSRYVYSILTHPTQWFLRKISNFSTARLMSLFQRFFLGMTSVSFVRAYQLWPVQSLIDVRFSPVFGDSGNWSPDFQIVGVDTD